MKLDFAIKEDFPIVISTIVAAAGVVAGLKFDPTTGVVTAGGVIFSALLGYFKAKRAEANARDVATIGATATIETNSKTVLVQTVTNERAKWRSEMRDAAAELTTLLRASGDGHRIDWQRVNRLRSEIRLRLNPYAQTSAPVESRHEIDRGLHAALDQVDASHVRARSAHLSIAVSLEQHMARLLKNEWDKSKGEAVSGKLADEV
jgi:hypothetical protein